MTNQVRMHHGSPKDGRSKTVATIKQLVRQKQIHQKWITFETFFGNILRTTGSQDAKENKLLQSWMTERGSKKAAMYVWFQGPFSREVKCVVETCRTKTR